MLEARAPAERELAPLGSKAEAARRSVRFDPGGAASLVLAVGADLAALSDAIDRLALFAGDRSVRDTDVAQVVANVREASQFELARRDRRSQPRSRTRSLLHQLMKQQEPGLLVLAFVARQDTDDRARQETRSSTVMTLRRRCDLPPFIASKVGSQSKRWTAAQLTRGLLACA